VCKLITGIYYEGKQHFEHPSCSSLIAAHDARKKEIAGTGLGPLASGGCSGRWPKRPFIGDTFFFTDTHLRPRQLDSEWITVTPDEEKDEK